MSVQNYRLGGMATDTVSDLIFLWGQVTTSANVTHFRKAFTTAGYQVTSGKTLYVARARILRGGNTSSTICVKFGYADNDVGMDTATARTNPVMAWGIDDTSNNGYIFNPGVEFGASGRPPEGDAAGFQTVFPLAVSTKYPFARVPSDGVVTGIALWCFEA